MTSPMPPLPSADRAQSPMASPFAGGLSQVMGGLQQAEAGLQQIAMGIPNISPMIAQIISQLRQAIPEAAMNSQPSGPVNGPPGI